MKETNENIDELIALNLAGEANPEQMQALQQWIAASSENEKYYAQLKTLFEASAKAREIKAFDTDKAWMTLQEKIKQNKKDKSKIISLFKKNEFMKVAAGFLLLLSITYIMNQVFNNNVANQISFKSDKRAVEKTLADGSVLHLNKKSNIKYSKDFNTKDRKVELQGEAFFDAKHNEKLPFTVVVDNVFIEDVGTSFNVKAYPDKETIDVAVLSGEVKFYASADKGVSLHAGEAGAYNKVTKTFSTSVLSDKNLSAYKDKIFVFENTPLHSVIGILNDVYQSNIQVSNPNLNACQLTVTFENESLDKVLDVIAATFNLKVTKSEKGILLEGDDCGK